MLRHTSLPTLSTRRTSSTASNFSAKLTQRTGYAGESVFIGTESTPGAPPSSVRLESVKAWKKGLFIADIKHMPGSACGVWPAFWTFAQDKEWPNGGEIDIIENISMASNNSVTLHTSAGCNMDSKGSAPVAKLQLPDCLGEGNTGCSIHSNVPNSFGTDFNNIGGGVYAMEWTSSSISVYFFPRASIPADIASGKPDPSKWGAPQAKFVGNTCDIDKYFSSHKIIFNTTFCGDWAGKKWKDNASCAVKAETCDAYVKNNPKAFTEAYWLINSVKVYQTSA
ncbi:putative endo-1,3(4)-beta-glucanase [Glarea lozoyensis 74030]|uniref:Putative endo-1,3(4)-beta-glucanase n=1 Tax=Glarea lozoyensis (strain ATCC 74030 / MF5533) TaxID=1104152 RepID=H0EG57_GLAL7|nr:putative endo-1,3(4)-beta-glucanase [Glarea lozoyensis 74030]